MPPDPVSARLTILGCGSSGGVPRVASGWGAADPTNPRNRRRRCSVLIERTGAGGTTRVLIDLSPDLREQLLDAAVDRLDAVLMTHDHADHTHGIDDLRPLYIASRRRVPIYADEATGAILRTRFDYCFSSPSGSDYPPIADERRMVAGRDVEIEGPGGGLSFTPILVEHGRTAAFGFRFGRAAYVPDVSAVPDGSVANLHGLDLLVLDALRYTPHPTHFSVSEALAFIEVVRPKKAVLTNLHTDIDYARLAAELPEGIEPAFDGMVLPC